MICQRRPAWKPSSSQSLLTAVVTLALATGLSGQPAPELKPEVGNPLPPVTTAPKTIRVVTFNVHSIPATELVRGLRDDPELTQADIFLLQEVESHEGEGKSRAHQAAEALHLNYVYAPARTIEGGTHGLAILSRFPLADVRVLQLPLYDLGFNTRQRIALAATVEVAGRSLRLWNLHLDTRINSHDRIEQLRPAVEAARAEPGPVVVGGDFNTAPVRWLLHVLPVFRSNQAGAVDDFMRGEGFATPFANGQATSEKAFLNLRLDSLYVRGLKVKKIAVAEASDVSDHAAVWMDLAWPPPEEAAPQTVAP